MKKKSLGFTLIELLAIIVILAIIAVITVPVILDIIENAKKSTAETSALGYLNAVETKIVMNNLDKTKNGIKDGNYSVDELSNMGVEVNGNKPTSGSVIITNNKIKDCTLMIDKYEIKCLGNGKVTINLTDDLIINNNILYSWAGEYYIGFLQDETFELLNELNIKTIYHSFNDLYINEEEMIADNIINKGYDVYHLIGDSSWYNNFDDIKIEIDNAYNYNIRKSKKIKGVVLDIEFYVTDEYKTNPDTVVEQLLNTYNQVVTYAHNKNLEVIFCLPSWLDSYYPSELEELIKISDGVSIMNYNQKVILEGITFEVEMAKKHNKKISNIAEFDNLEEDYITYRDEGLDKAFEDWEMLSNELKYNKLNFAFHHLNSLLEMKKGHKTYKYIVKDSDSNIKPSERVYISVKSGNDLMHFKRNSNSQGLVSVTLPQDNNLDIQVSMQNYDIANINNISTTQTLNDNEIIIGSPKEKYTIEYYFHSIDDDGYVTDFKNKKVVVYSKDTGEIFIRTTSDAYGHIAVNLTYGETYYIEIFDGNDYIISVDNEDMTSNITNEFNHNKSDGSYLAGDVYVKTK